jgi:hypothetical protein
MSKLEQETALIQKYSTDYEAPRCFRARCGMEYVCHLQEFDIVSCRQLSPAPVDCAPHILATCPRRPCEAGKNMAITPENKQLI